MDAILRLLEAEDESRFSAMSPTDAIVERYAGRVVHNQLIDKFRREQREAEAIAQLKRETGNFKEEEPSPRSHAIAKLCQELIEQLPVSEQALLEAYFYGAEAFREESMRQRLKPGTARVRVHRLLKRLRERGTGLPPSGGD